MKPLFKCSLVGSISSGCGLFTDWRRGHREEVWHGQRQLRRGWDVLLMFGCLGFGCSRYFSTPKLLQLFCHCLGKSWNEGLRQPESLVKLGHACWTVPRKDTPQR